MHLTPLDRYSFVLFCLLPALFSSCDQICGLKPFFNSIESQKLLNSIEGDKALLFFGYPGCDDVCPPTMVYLAQWSHRFAEASDASETLAIVFVNLVSGFDDDFVQAFARGYHPRFQTLNPTPKELNRLLNDMHTQASKSLFKENQIVHSRALFLIEKSETDWTLSRIFPSGKLPEKSFF